VVPEVMHGGTTLLPRPAADRSGGNCTSIGPRSTAPRGWDVMVAPGQYLIVGGASTVPHARHRMFIRPEQLRCISGDYSRRPRSPGRSPRAATTTATSGQPTSLARQAGMAATADPKTLTTGLPPALSQNLLDKPPPVRGNTDW